MQVLISGLVTDSPASPENGRIEFSQVQRLANGEVLITESLSTAQVVSGELRTLDGDPFTLPHNPEGTAVRIREILGGETFEWWAAVPEVGSIEYRQLPIVQSEDVAESVWGPPPWIAEFEITRDETIQAVQEGIDVAESLGGLSGIQGLIGEAQDAAGNLDAAVTAATTQANRAKVEADRAETAADSIDMGSINNRLDSIEDKTLPATTARSGVAMLATSAETVSGVNSSKTVTPLGLSVIGRMSGVHPESYGADGNGITNDSAAFQAAVDSLGSEGGVIVLNQGSEYYLSNTALDTN